VVAHWGHSAMRSFQQHGCQGFWRGARFNFKIKTSADLLRMVLRRVRALGDWLTAAGAGAGADLCGCDAQFAGCVLILSTILFEILLSPVFSHQDLTGTVSSTQSSPCLQ
jgi:hypothetical protein